MRKDGTFSNLWEATIEKGCEMYIYSRDNFQNQKVSLHATGQCHIMMPDKSRILKWIIPYDNQVPAFRLIFPIWGIGLNWSQLNHRVMVKKRHKSHIIILGHETNMVVVSFFVIDAAFKFPSIPNSIRLGDLELIPDKRLVVVAHKEPEGDLRKRVQSSLNYSADSIVETLEFQPKSDSDDNDNSLCFCVMGMIEETGFIVAFPAKIKKSDTV